MKLYRELIKPRMQQIAGIVATAAKGLFYYNTTNDRPYIDDGTASREIMLRHLLTKSGAEEPILAAEGGTGKTAALITAATVGDTLVVNAGKTGFDFGAGGGGSALEVENEGVSLSTAVTKINFSGDGVVTTEPVADEILVTIGTPPPPTVGIGLFMDTVARGGLEKIAIETLSNSVDYGALSVDKANMMAIGSSTRSVSAGALGETNVIDYGAFAVSSTWLDFGNLTVGTASGAGASNQIRGLFAGGNRGVEIDYITIASTGNATTFSDMRLTLRVAPAGLSDPVRGIFGGGHNNVVNYDDIDYVAFDTLANALDFGNLLSVTSSTAGASNSTRGLFAGGVSGNVIQYIQIQTLGNSVDFGDLTVSRNADAVSTGIRAVIGAGTNVMDYVAFDTLGNAVDFGDLPSSYTQAAACCNSHGGL